MPHVPLLDDDLHFAAYMMVKFRCTLRKLRERAVGAIRELSRRLKSTTAHLRKLQDYRVASASKGRHLALILVLTIIMLWPDPSLAAGVIAGTKAVGSSAPTGAFPAQSYRVITADEIFHEVQSHNESTIWRANRDRHNEHAAFIQEASDLDTAKGFADKPLSVADFERKWPGVVYRLIPRMVIVQSTGKKRCIDNADAGGQTELSSDGNKLQLCSAMRPYQHVCLLEQEMEAQGQSLATVDDSLETGGEDWPDAYRHTPQLPAEAFMAVVCFFSVKMQCVVLQLYYGQLFGLPLAVTSFNRYSRFSEAAGRRFTFTLTSKYFDDATVQDWKSAQGSGQSAVRTLQAELGTPYADDKHQPMAAQGDFLGLCHSLADIKQGFIPVWIRQRLQDKLLDIMDTAEQRSFFPKGVAAKFYGCANFMENATWGKIGRAGLLSIVERQHSSLTRVTDDILGSFRMVRAILQEKPLRKAVVIHNKCPPRFVVASDASLESDRQGGGGWLYLGNPTWPSEQRLAFVVDIPDKMYDLWKSPKVIAQLELAMIQVALVSQPHHFRDQSGVWYVDNIAALMALVRGRSNNDELDAMAMHIQCLLFGLNCFIYFDWIQSDSNWADGISRVGLADDWLQRHYFVGRSAQVHLALWQLPFRALLRLATFL